MSDNRPPKVEDEMEKTLLKYSELETNDQPAYRGEEDGGYSATADHLVKSIIGTNRTIRGEEEIRDRIVPILNGEAETGGPEVFNWSLDDETLESMGVRSEDYGALRKELVEVLERGLRGEMVGPRNAAEDLAFNYEE